MDVDTDISKYLDVIEGQKRVLQKAKSRQGQRPRDRKPREQMYLEFMMASMATSAQEQREQGYLMHSSFIPPAYLPCTTPLAQLKSIAIRDLKLETHHRGKYLLLRAITPPNRMTAILVLAEDDYGDVVVLQLYQQKEESIREATDIVDVGTILLVKEPFFKVMASGDYGLRVDHLSDIVHIDKDDPVVPKGWYPKISEVEDSAESSKIKGDSAMGAGKYWKAIESYSKAISQKPASDRIEVIKRNRSLAYLRTKQFDNALSDTGFPNFGLKPSEKALFRAAEALYFLQRFEECSRVADTLCSHFPNNRQAVVVSNRAQSRCSEARSGDYDFKLLQREAKKLQPPQLDHATYIGPVAVRESTGKGRGLFVTKAVKAGDLLLCEKAFSHAYVPETGNGNSKVTLLINPETGRGFMGGQADLIKLIVQKIYHNPSIAPAFTTLHHGSYNPSGTIAMDGTPVVDTFLAEQIMTLNVFGCPRSSLDTHKDAIANHSKKPEAYHSCGIWIQASYINHSCTSNARRSFIGDMMIVRATQDLEPGTEVTFWYQIPGGRSKSMKEKLAGWGFTCTCAICQDDKETRGTVVAERRKLLNELERAFQQVNQDNMKLSKVTRLLKALNNTYSRPADEVPRLLLWDPQLLLTRMYMAQDKFVKALESFQQVLASLGFVVVGADSTPVAFKIVKWGLVVDHLIEAFLHARSAFGAVGAWDDSKMAEVYARTTYKIVVGEETSFESTYAGRGF